MEEREKEQEMERNGRDAHHSGENDGSRNRTTNRDR